eukprot:TRINITY_DN1815_c0_g3_i1.p1 TRINITY_DN1815_c0_g3~~TRINITY_DN1815_c0_g3_i1.p1  ORF type:complete len:812 (-),score=100.53 TRINITY_DN1815_c0_g3_i1:543-2978(-)
MVATKFTFQVRGETHFGETIKIVGSDVQLGSWDVEKAVELQTCAATHPLWSTAPMQISLPCEYKYVKVCNGGEIVWEGGELNRTLSADSPSSSPSEPCVYVVDDGGFDYIQPEPFGYLSNANVSSPGSLVPSIPAKQNGFKVVVFGSSVAGGHKAWRFRGWAEMLGEVLHDRFGYGFTNVAIEGLNTTRGLELFREKVVPHQPDIVILAFGLGNEGLASCPPHERAHVCQGFLGRIAELTNEVFQMGALPVLGGLYPHGNYNAEHFYWLKKAEEEMRLMDVSILEWMDSVAHPDGSGCWDDGVSFDPSHPNTEGHRRMFSKIDLSTFEHGSVTQKLQERLNQNKKNGDTKPIVDINGLRVISALTDDRRCEISISNTSQEAVRIHVGWGQLQSSLREAQKRVPGILKQGLYIADESVKVQSDSLRFLAVNSDGGFESDFDIPAKSTLMFQHTSSLFRPSSGFATIFYDGNLAIVQESGAFVVFNETNSEYNIHPMWQELRLATRKLPYGMYEDGSGKPFTSALISEHGLSSRVKIPPKSGMKFRLVKELEKVERIALLPIGDRCSIRMLLHKIEYDGPCYPFDLTRSTSLADVSDILRHKFDGLWEPSQLQWDGEQGRIFHTRWHGVSFAHEVEWEDGDNPWENMEPVYQRMAKRYSGRAARFSYACKHATRTLFVRTGCASRGEVEDILSVMSSTFNVKPELLLISDQPSQEFSGLEGVTHIQESFNPDRMYEDQQYWIHCANRFRAILDNVGITTANLYWCPNNLKEAEKEKSEPPPKELVRTCKVKTLSHSNLFELNVPTKERSVSAP